MNERILLQDFAHNDYELLSIASVVALDGQGAVSASTGYAGNREWEYTPSKDDNGQVEIEFEVTSSGGDSLTATKVIWIEPINDGPEIQSALNSYTTNEDFDLTITSDQLLSGFVDAEGDSLSVINLKVDGEFIEENSGSWSISALSNNSNDRTVQYTVTDGSLEKEVTTKIIN